MKQIKMVCVALAAFLCATTANGQTKNKSKAKLKTEIDTLSYALGIGNTEGFLPYLKDKMGVDTTETNLKDFLRGLNESMKSDKKKEAYFAGIQIGKQMQQGMIKNVNKQVFGDNSTQSISVDNFLTGFEDALHKGGLMSTNEASQITRTKMEAFQAKRMEEQYGENRRAGEDFLKENAQNAGVQTLPGGVQYKVLTQGTGVTPKATDKVKVNYEGKLVNGTVFDSSYKRGQPATFLANQVIKGWTEALTQMPVGSKWELYIPQEKGYGARQAGNIPPYSTLIFTVELLDIVE